jgi:chromosomal replication initiator protein
MGVICMVAPEIVYEEPIGPAQPDYVIARRIKRATAEQYGVSVEDLESQRRTKLITNARHCAMWRIKQALSWSTTHISRSFGKCDPSTAINALRKHQARIDAVLKVKKELEDLAEAIVDQGK